MSGVSDEGAGADDGAKPPADPITALAGAAVELHELYKSLQAAGFSPTEALYLVGQGFRRKET